MPQVSSLATLSSLLEEFCLRTIFMTEVKKITLLLIELRKGAKSVPLNIGVTCVGWWCFGTPGFWYQLLLWSVTFILTQFY